VKDCRIESIAAARHGPDEARSVICEGPSELADALHKGVVCDGEIRPDRSKQLIFGNQPARILDQIPQHSESLGPQRYFVSIDEKRAAINIMDLAVEAQLRFSGQRWRGGISTGHRETSEH
jgi:hypothetical protein